MKRPPLRPRVVLAAAASIVAACAGTEPPPQAPAPPVAPADPVWIAEAARACARIASCTRSHDSPRLRDPGSCVEWWWGLRGDPKEPDPLQRCLAGATTCEQIETCMHGGGDARAAAFCVQRPGVVSGCDGDRFVSCGDDEHESTVVDCAALGATCKELRSPGGLVQRGCWSPAKCPPGAPEARCDGASAVVSCHDGILERNVCRGGTTCEDRKDDDAEPTASCAFHGAARCDALFPKRCEGDRLVECAGVARERRLHVVDCARLGLRCSGTGPRTSCWVPARVECDKDMLPRCEDGAIVFCAAGRLERVACASLGMGACDPAARGTLVACAANAPSSAASP